jgi:hypothetical protein
MDMNVFGDSTVTWRQTDGANSSIWANRYDVGTGWGSACQIAINDSESFEPPIVSSGSTGSVVVAWSAYDWVSWTVWTARWNESEGWGNAERIETSGDSSLFDVEVDGWGNAFVSWEQGHSGHTDVWSIRYDDSDNEPIPEFGAMTFVVVGIPLVVTAVHYLYRKAPAR